MRRGEGEERRGEGEREGEGEEREESRERRAEREESRGDGGREEREIVRGKRTGRGKGGGGKGAGKHYPRARLTVPDVHVPARRVRTQERGRGGTKHEIDGIGQTRRARRRRWKRFCYPSSDPDMTREGAGPKEARMKGEQPYTTPLLLVAVSSEAVKRLVAPPIFRRSHSRFEFPFDAVQRMSQRRRRRRERRWRRRRRSRRSQSRWRMEEEGR
eukprot:757250-Hanusia_phi.AAC.4